LDQIVTGAKVRICDKATCPIKDQQDDTVDPEVLKGCVGVLKGRDQTFVGGCVVQFNAVAGTRFVKMQAQDLEFVQEPGNLGPGSLVKIADNCKAPKYGWGAVKRNMIGVCIATEDSGVVKVRWPVHPAWKGQRDELELAAVQQDSNAALGVDLRIRASYHVRGGILADKIGYGKTATTIALIDSSLGRDPPPVPEVDENRFIPAKGTLIIVPSNLFEQWITEISKFVWDGRALRAKMKGGWSPQSCPMKIFAMSNVTPLKNVKAEEIAEADIVICSYRLLFSKIYVQRREELGGGRNLAALAEKVHDLIRSRAEMPSGGKKGGAMVDDWKDLKFPVLEMFYWKRVVFDEFHELESFDSLQQNSLQFMRAHFRWGLTGTPPIDSNAGGIFMSSLFRIDLPGYLKDDGSRSGLSGPNLEPWESDRLLTETVGHFLDAYARQNTAELPHIRLEEHVVVVSHTAEERALYLGQAHDAPDFSSGTAFDNEEGVKALEKLLKLCSHFQAGGGETTGNAKEECVRLIDAKERRLVRARNQLCRCCRVMALLQQKMAKLKKPQADQAKKWSKELDKAKEQVAAESESGKVACKELTDEVAIVAKEDHALLLDKLAGHRPKDQELLNALGPDNQDRGSFEQWVAFSASTVEVATLQHYFMGQANEQAQNLRELHEASASLDFFRRTVRALAGGSAEERSCTVCLEDNLPLEKLSITPCAHAFCVDCLKATIAKFNACSICRRQLTAKDVRPLAAELEAPATASEGASSSSSSSSATPNGTTLAESATGKRFDMYGTKLAVVVQKLLELRKEDPGAKVILFVQFDDLKRKVFSAMAEFGIPCAMLQGGVGQRASIIRDWQHNPTSQTFVLLLSLNHAASGTNLTAASHVVFLHPMLASTAEKAVGYELQAIGRARRHGQLRSVVHVWRFVTAGTLEQVITEQHQGALWQCEQVRQQQHKELLERAKKREQEAAQAAEAAAEEAPAEPENLPEE